MTHLAMKQIFRSTKGTPAWKQAVEPTNTATREPRLHAFRNNIPIGMCSMRQPDFDRHSTDLCYFGSTIGLGFQLELYQYTQLDASRFK